MKTTLPPSDGEPQAIGDSELLKKLQLRTHAAIDSLQKHILDLDFRLGGGQAGPALAAMAALVESVMLHYVSEQKILQAKHHREYVCIERAIWDKAKGTYDERHADERSASEGETRTEIGSDLPADPSPDAGDAGDREGSSE